MNYLHEYSTFETVEQLNESINGHIQRNQYELNETDRTVLLTLSRYSVKYKGVSHLKISTLADIVGKSDRTMQRSIRKLEQLKIVERLEFIRKKSGGHGANIYRILPFNVGANSSEREESEKSTQASDEAMNEPIESINLISNNSSNTYDSREPIESNESISAEQVIHESIANNTPKPIVDLFRPFFYGSELYRYIGLLFKAKHRPHAKIRIEPHIDDYRACIYDIMRRYKQGYIRNLDSYLFASIRALSRRLYVTAS